MAHYHPRTPQSTSFTLAPQGPTIQELEPGAYHFGTWRAIGTVVLSKFAHLPKGCTVHRFRYEFDLIPKGYTSTSTVHS